MKTVLQFTVSDKWPTLIDEESLPFQIKIENPPFIPPVNTEIEFRLEDWLGENDRPNYEEVRKLPSPLIAIYSRSYFNKEIVYIKFHVIPQDSYENFMKAENEKALSEED